MVVIVSPMISTIKGCYNDHLRIPLAKANWSMSRKFHNPTSVNYKLYESQQQCIINDEEVAKQCTQAQKAQIEEMQRRIAELNVNALVNQSKYDLNNGE